MPQLLLVAKQPHRMAVRGLSTFPSTKCRSANHQPTALLRAGHVLLPAARAERDREGCSGSEPLPSLSTQFPSCTREVQQSFSIPWCERTGMAAPWAGTQTLPLAPSASAGLSVVPQCSQQAPSTSRSPALPL